MIKFKNVSLKKVDKIRKSKFKSPILAVIFLLELFFCNPVYSVSNNPSPNSNDKNTESASSINSSTTVQIDQTAQSNQQLIPSKSKIVTGTVVDEKGEPIIGLTVSVKGLTTGTNTDADGNYVLQVKPGQILVFSYLGYVSKELPVGDLATINVAMNESTTGLDEVVVVGYGEQKKISLTGSISSIKTKEIKQSAVSNLSSALVGRLPGLIARQPTGEVGNNGSSLALRGFATYKGSTSPLILVDGIERDGFEFIEPNEVETITILKDASATAVYGVKGANGVVLVTTKRGEVSDKTKVTANIEHAFLTPMAMLDYMNSADYFRVYRRGLINDGRVGEASVYTDEYISKYDQTLDRPDDYNYLYPNVDWKKELIKDVTGRTVATLDMSGGTNKYRYFISASFMDEEGIYKGTSNSKGYDSQAREKRFNFRSNTDIQVNKWLSAELNLATIVRNRAYPGESGASLFNRIKCTPSYVFPKINPDGSIAERPGDVNAYALLTQTGYHKMLNSYLQGTGALKADLGFILKGLTSQVRFSYDAASSGGYTRGKSYSAYIYQGAGKYTQYKSGDEFLGYNTDNDYWKVSTNPQFYLNYNTKIGKNDFAAMLMYRLASQNWRASTAIDALPHREQGLVGRFSYAYNSKYFTELNFGFNGSENFMKGKRMGFFPALSASWVISNEEFMESTKSWLDQLKIRGSAGKVGNPNPSGRFAYQSQWNLNAGSYTFGNNYSNSMPGAVATTAGNPDVTWETATKYNLGMDLVLNKGVLSIVGDVFYEHRTGIYEASDKTTSALLGLPTFPQLNTGIVQNKGFEIEISHRNKVNKDLYYEIKGSYTYTKDKILEIKEEVYRTDKPWLNRKGKSIKEIKTYVAKGLFQSYEEIAGAPTQFGTLQPGDVRYQDTDNDGVITSDDMVYSDKLSEPNQIVGISGQIQYKGFDLSMLFQGAFGRSLFINGTALFGDNYEMRQIFADFDGNYWTPENQKAKYPRAMSQKNNNNTLASTIWLKNGDYMRLKNVEIGYTLPTNFSKKANIVEARIYVNGNNLLTWDKLHLFDPEEDSGSPTYPLMRTYNVGFRLTF